MQTASSNLAMALSGAGGVWTDPYVAADWLGDGYQTPTGSAQLMVRDPFDRTTVNGWQDPYLTTRRQWAVLGSASSEFACVGNPGTPGVATQSNTTVNLIRRSLLDTSNSDLTLTADVTVPVMPSGAGLTCWLIGRSDNTFSNGYIARLDLSPGGLANLVMLKMVGGVLQAGLSTVNTGYLHKAGQRWQLKLQCTGGQIRGKAWPLPGTEPVTWMSTVADTSVPSASTNTWIGLASRLETGNTNTLPVTLTWRNMRAVAPGVDDLSRQVGDITVKQFIDDGYPSSATFISGVGISTYTGTIGPPAPYLTGTPMLTGEYFSPYNEDSPMYGLARDVAPMVAELGMVTTAGQERVRVFTGQMTDIPVKSGTATLQATSATRLDLAALVQAPAFPRGTCGLSATWPVSWAMYQCGVYVAPAPRPGCRWYMPMAGSFRPFEPSQNDIAVRSADGIWREGTYTSKRIVSGGSTTPTLDNDLQFLPGPYLLACDTQCTATEARWVEAHDMQFTSTGVNGSDDLLSQASSTGRIEFWVKGDAADGTNAPGTAVGYYVRFELSATSSAKFVRAGIDLGRHVFVTVNDGAGHTSTLTSTAQLPSDGNWYKAGAAWSVSGKKLWVAHTFSGATVQQSAAAATFVTSSLFARESYDNGWPAFWGYLPTAEIRVTGREQANPDNYPTWAWDAAATFTPGGRVGRSNLELVAMADRQPTDAWAYIANYAQAETASMWTDEHDVVNYQPVGYWVKTAQQTVVDTISTEVNAETVDVNTDITKVRNSIRVTYNNMEVDANNSQVFALSTVFAVPPGYTTQTFALQDSLLQIPTGNAIFYADDTDFATYNNNIPFDYVSLNTQPDGSGTYANEFDGLVIERDSWDAGQMTWRFTNPGPLTYYTANASNQPALKVFGIAGHVTSAFATDADPASIALRGERALQVQAGVIQSGAMARFLCGLLKQGLKDPRPAVEEFNVFADPRRQPGDLIQFADPSITKINGQWRVVQVNHAWKPGTQGDMSYTQALIVRPTKPLGTWGQSSWGQCLWQQNSKH